jgi:acyl carrier protein
MTDDEARELIRSTLRQVAPEADLDEVGSDETLQEALDLDSIDFLNLVVGLHEATGLEIPERDYPQLSTLEGCVAYLASRAGPDIRGGG